MNWNPFTISTLLLALTSIVLTVLFFVFGKNKLQRIWGIYNFSVTIWGVCGFLAGISTIPEKSLFWWRIAHVGVATIPIFLFHAIILFCNSKRRNLLRAIYLQGIIFILFIPNQYFIKDIRFSFDQFYYPVLGPIYSLFFLLWCLIVFFSQYELFCLYQKTTGLKKSQIRYLFFGLVLGFLGGVTNFLPGYISAIYPYGNFTIPIYSLIVTYAIFRYRLLDISVVITRTGIFIAVYSIVLGLPFAIAFGWKEQLLQLVGVNWWIVPMVSLTILATAGPFIYLYIQNRAEEQLLKEQRRYQSTLSQASSGMGRIKDLKRLLELIVYVVTRAVRLEHSSVFIYDDTHNKYVLGAYKRSVGKNILEEIVLDSPLVEHLIRNKVPIVYDEIKQRVQDYTDAQLSHVEESLKLLDAALIVPILIESRLLAILVLGKKKSGKLYGEDDLSVFTILANQAALAIENAQFYEDIKLTQEQLFQAEKMATIGTMADGLSHQINNRFHALGFIAGDALDTIKLKKDTPMSDDTRTVMVDLERALTRIQENVVQGGEVVQGLLKYTRKGDQGFAPVEIDKLVTAALEMAQFKIKTHELKISREYDLEGPKIKGNFTQLQEVFFNMIDNAYDAMMQRKNEKQEHGFQPTLRIQTEIKGQRILVKFTDNGIGVKPEDFKKIFTPFFTTKLSSKKGTGLGLYVIKKIIEDNHEGKVTFASEYMKGTSMLMDLPIALA